MAITQSTIDGSVRKELDLTPVEPGRYTLKVLKGAKTWTSKSGNTVLLLRFGHVDENFGGAGFHRGTFGNFITDTPNSYEMKELAGLLTVLDVDKELMVGATIGADPEQGPDEKGKAHAVIFLNNGEVFRFPVGELVSAYLTVKDDMNGVPGNIAKSFQKHEELV